MKKREKNNHSFAVNDAKKYGIAAAVILNNIHYWLEVSEIKGENIYKYSERQRQQKEGKDADITELDNKSYVWTCGSISEYEKLFPYLTQKQIQAAIDRLNKEGVILIANFNKTSNDDKNDRILWYTIPSEFCQNKGKISATPKSINIFSTAKNILVTISEYDNGEQLAIVEKDPQLPQKPKSEGELLNEAIALFMSTFPADFIGRQSAFSKPMTREAVQALLNRLGKDGIKLLLEKYNSKKLEKFCPVAGTVYEFCTSKLAKIEAYTNKDNGLYAQKSVSSSEQRSDLERKINAKVEASREENRQALEEWLKNHPDDGMKHH